MKEWPKQIEIPVPCKRCGKIPKLVGKYTRAYYSLITYNYECRKWWGGLCQKGPEHTNECDWADLAQRCAAVKWNEQNDHT